MQNHFDLGLLIDCITYVCSVTCAHPENCIGSTFQRVSHRTAFTWKSTPSSKHVHAPREFYQSREINSEVNLIPK